MIYINSRFLTQELTGVQRFAEQICLALQDIRSDVVFLSPENIKRTKTASKLNLEIIGKNTGHAWEQMDLPRYLKGINSPLLVNLGNTGPIFYKNKIVTQHDVTYKRFPQSYSWKFKLIYNLLVPLLLKNAKSIVTVSNFSKAELIDVYHCDSDKIHVIYNSASEIFRSDGRDVKKGGYFLAVSSTNYHKNFHGLISEFSNLPKDLNIKLKIIGGMAKSFTNMDFESLVESTDRVDFLGRVSDEELLELYANASAFVFPSLYEGFGIPPLEAQACACPVISSNMASMPEVLGSSALYFDPLKPGEMASALEKVARDSDLRSQLVTSGLDNIKRFSWAKSAEELHNLINRLSKK
ncbi:D-inositol 3-phosphate glycosyltransferase [Serratia grimesii]|uniref:glycosyltransferase family 4 protein n=1 Tax=Serratia grimesii TaxID=82995 RepID=UPI00076F3670|nr:glycosyltransferase family 1 protein [Serratia grimesii]CUW09551.1 D-inositol 3-phosphate glycosyltransferase [Serratia grimesii]SMZ55930.1 D-inositol 3-phosphate glycosyltransferase [Serratia grimesii]